MGVTYRRFCLRIRDLSSSVETRRKIANKIREGKQIATQCYKFSMSVIATEKKGFRQK